MTESFFQKLPEGQGAVPGGALTNKITDQLERLSTNGSPGQLSNSAGRFSLRGLTGFSFWEGILQGTLSPATNRLTTPSTANVLLLTPGANGVLTQSSITLEVTNRDPFAVYFEDEYVAGSIYEGTEYRVDFPGRRVLYGVADADIASNGTGNVSLYDVGSDTGSTVSAYNITSVQADIGSMVEITVDGPGERWILKPLECPATA